MSTHFTPLSMTPRNIERAAELAMDALDRRLMNHTITQRDYDAAVRALDANAERQWAEWKRDSRGGEG